MTNNLKVLRAIKNISARHISFATKIKPLKVLLDVRCTGTIIAIELKVDSSGYASSIRQGLYNAFLEQGVLLRPLGNVIYMIPPYCITEKELNKVYEVIEHQLNLLS